MSGKTLYTRIIFILIFSASKISFSQTLHWVKQMGSTDWNEGTAIATDATGNVYSIGIFYGTVDFDPGTGVFNLTASGVQMEDAFISKLDSAGNFIWAGQIGGAGSE